LLEFGGGFIIGGKKYAVWRTISYLSVEVARCAKRQQSGVAGVSLEVLGNYLHGCSKVCRYGDHNASRPGGKRQA
jgi:hypothetical protein